MISVRSSKSLVINKSIDLRKFTSVDCGSSIACLPRLGWFKKPELVAADQLTITLTLGNRIRSWFAHLRF